MSVPLGSWYKTYEGHGEKNQHIEKMRLQRKGNIEMQVRVTNIVGQIDNETINTINMILQQAS